MTRNEFAVQVAQAVPVGTILKNPGGGTSEIVQITDHKISYVRGSSTIGISFDDLFSAYSNFKGAQVSSSELRAYAPAIFDSAARSAVVGTGLARLSLVRDATSTCRSHRWLSDKTTLNNS